MSSYPITDQFDNSKKHHSLRKPAIAVAISAALLATPAMAADTSVPKPIIGMGSGFVSGALIGGPAGAIIGGALGLFIGNDMAHQEDIKSKQKLIAQQDTQLNQVQLEKQQASKHASEQALTLSSKEMEFQQLASQMDALNHQYQSLKKLLGGLELAVYFDLNSSTVKPGYKPMLESLAEAANEVAGLTIELTGRTDASGAPELNQKLSGERAEVVYQELVDKGLQNPPVQFGSAQPQQVTQHDKALYSPQDRRVDLNFRFSDTDANESLYSVR